MPPAYFALSTSYWSKTVESPRPLIVLGFVSLVFSVLLFVSAAVMQFSGMHDAAAVGLPGAAFNFIGIIAVYYGRSIWELGERLERLEAQLNKRTEA